MKQIAMGLIISIILVMNTHTASVTSDQKDTTQNTHKLAIYEQTINQGNRHQRTLNEIETDENALIESGNLCVLHTESQIQTEQKQEKIRNKHIASQNKQKHSIDESDNSTQNEQDNTVGVDHNENTQYMIPDEAIRLRILAHSDSQSDQHIKKIVRDRVNKHIRATVAHIDKIETARTVIKATIPTLETLIAETLDEYNEEYPFQVDFENDVPFPLKTYGPYVYPAGDYEAILITLGDGVGENWWCVLFPPLCFIDFFNSTTVVDADDTSNTELDDEHSNTDDENVDSDVEVRFFLFDLFNFS